MRTSAPSATEVPFYVDEVDDVLVDDYPIKVT
jgi:hypothetical protein